MTLENNLGVNQFVKLVTQNGEACDFGCNESALEEMLARAKWVSPNKPCCAVSSWTWADLDIDPLQAEKIRSEGVEPSFVYANNIVHDEADSWAVGLCVRTSFLKCFYKPCIFITRNTNYLLVGPGVRLKVLPEVLTNLSFDSV